jgi:hypothetical protein
MADSAEPTVIGSSGWTLGWERRRPVDLYAGGRCLVETFGPDITPDEARTILSAPDIQADNERLNDRVEELTAEVDTLRERYRADIGAANEAIRILAGLDGSRDQATGATG